MPLVPRRTKILALVMLAGGCASEPRPSTSSAGEASKTSAPRPEVLTPDAARARFCNGPPRIVFSYSDATGKVGGYRVTSKVRDSPITYFDDRGEALGSFHIYGDPQTNERTESSIERLQKAFPVERQIECEPAPVR